MKHGKYVLHKVLMLAFERYFKDLTQNAGLWNNEDASECPCTIDIIPTPSS